jgi:DNA-binding HxlR family transcriptional regulator
MEVSIAKKIASVKVEKWLKVCYTSYMHKMSRHTPGQETANCSTHVPMQRAMSLIGDMWTLMIVYNLLSGPKRFGELRDAMGNVSPKTVSQRLKMLEEDGFVDRHAFAEIPPRVEYQLTEKGQALADILEAIKDFSERYLSDDEATSPATPLAPSSLH